jgi:hypothetical protein
MFSPGHARFAGVILVCRNKRVPERNSLFVLEPCDR